MITFQKPTFLEQGTTFSAGNFREAIPQFRVSMELPACFIHCEFVFMLKAFNLEWLHAVSKCYTAVRGTALVTLKTVWHQM